MSERALLEPARPADHNRSNAIAEAVQLMQTGQSDRKLASSSVPVSSHVDFDNIYERTSGGTCRAALPGKVSDCDWRPDAKAKGADEWFEASRQQRDKALEHKDGEYTVQRGDSMWTIAERSLKEHGGEKPGAAAIQQRMKEIVDANKDRFPGLDCNNHLLRPDMKLRIPDAHGDATRPGVVGETPRAGGAAGLTDYITGKGKHADVSGAGAAGHPDAAAGKGRVEYGGMYTELRGQANAPEAPHGLANAQPKHGTTEAPRGLTNIPRAGVGSPEPMLGWENAEKPANKDSGVPKTEKSPFGDLKKMGPKDVCKSQQYIIQGDTTYCLPETTIQFL
jgi:hypothetical protein